MYHKIASGLLKWCLTWAHLLELIYQYPFSVTRQVGATLHLKWAVFQLQQVKRP